MQVQCFLERHMVVFVEFIKVELNFGGFVPANLILHTIFVL
jgi:hypothetical protein